MIRSIADHASFAVERVGELVALRAAHLAAQAGKRSPVRRAR